MKPIGQQNYYEILDILPTATPEEIEQAYELAKRTYGDNSPATYSLFDSGERREIIIKSSQAYDTLSNENLRKHYDRDVMGIEHQKLSPGSKISKENIYLDEKSLLPSRPKSLPTPLLLPEMSTLTGKDLREFRESRNIPLQEIADNTRINISYFEYLERGHYHSLPPPVYLRSYILQYAAALGLDTEKVADRILALVELSKNSKQ